MSSQPRFRARAAATVLVGAVVAAGVAGCGRDYPLKNDDPAMRQDIAQSIVDLFVGTYNQEGMAVAVDYTFCADRVEANVKETSLDGAEYIAGSLSSTTPVTVKGDNGSGGMQLAATTGQRSYTAVLRDAPGQGWCIDSVKQAAPVSGEVDSGT